MQEGLQRAERRVVRWVIRERAHEERERLERGELFVERGRLRARSHVTLFSCKSVEERVQAVNGFGLL
jgi:hypothetical protein